MDILNTIGSICSIVSLIISLTTLCKVNQIKNKIEQKTNSFINKGTISPRYEVELICHNSLMDAIIDKFGPDVTTYACDQENFRVVVNVAVSHVFYSWVFGFKGLISIKKLQT